PAPAAKNAAHSASAGSTLGSNSQTLRGALRRTPGPGVARAATTAAAARNAARWAPTYLAPAPPSSPASARPCLADSSRAAAVGATLPGDRIPPGDGPGRTEETVLMALLSPRSQGQAWRFPTPRLTRTRLPGGMGCQAAPRDFIRT